MQYKELAEFIEKKMRMSHIYQPVMLISLLENCGKCHEKNIAEKLVSHDQSRQIEYYINITNNMVGKVLRNHGIISRNKTTREYSLLDYESLTSQERAHLIELCRKRLDVFLEARGKKIFDHRRKSSGYISGTIKYEVLERDGIIKEMIQELKKAKNSQYYYRSDSEIALMVLSSALKSEVEKLEINDESSKSNKSSKSNIRNISGKVKSSVSRLVNTNNETSVKKHGEYLSGGQGSRNPTEVWMQWTEAELNKLKEEYPKTNTQALARKLGRTLEAVRFQAKKHGLKKTKSYMQSLYESQMANPPHLQNAMEEKASEEPKKNNEKLEQDQNINFLHQLNRQLDTWLNSSEGKNHEHRELLAQIPDTFSLLCTLSNDNVVSEKSKSKLAKAITYFQLKFDFIPEAFIGPPGYLDDLIISALTIRYVMDYDNKDVVRNSWEGNKDITALIAEIIEKADDLVGPDIHKKLANKIA